MQYKKRPIRALFYNFKNDMPRNILRVILITSVIMWMMVIFGFSSANADQSRTTSDIITEIIVETFYEDYDELSYDAQQELWSNISFVVRKTGHFGEYAILAVLMSLLMLTYDNIRHEKKLYYLIAMVFCAIYAITDELHQGFVDGRSPMVKDVIIDTVGAAVGTLFVRTVYAIICSTIKKQNK